MKCHYLSVTKLSILFRNIRSTHHVDFNSLNCFNCPLSFRTGKNVIQMKIFANMIITAKM